MSNDPGVWFHVAFALNWRRFKTAEKALQSAGVHPETARQAVAKARAELSPTTFVRREDGSGIAAIYRNGKWSAWRVHPAIFGTKDAALSFVSERQAMVGRRLNVQILASAATPAPLRVN